jgi:hypothetical protein
MLMNIALGLVGAQFALAMGSKRAVEGLMKLPDYWLNQEEQRVGRPTAQRSAAMVNQVIGRGLVLAGDTNSVPLPHEYLAELAELMEGFGFDADLLTQSFATSMHDWRIAVGTLKR